MAIRIVDVKLTTNFSWQDIKNKADWLAIRNTNENWQQLIQTATPSGIVKVEIEVRENNWLGIRDDHKNWQEIMDKFNTWQDVKNY